MSSTSSPPGYLIGQVFGGYRVMRVIGEGGMGMVLEGRHEQLGRRAAIKILHPHISHIPGLLRRFFNEARAVNLIDHPSLVQVFDHGQLPDGTAYLIMEFIRGESLGARLKRGALPPSDVIRIGLQAAEALSATHAAGIVHRDLKPDNLMLAADPVAPGRERTKLLDFGIAKPIADVLSGPQTEAGAIMGTPLYMSPEQCRGAGLVSFPSDVYSLGVILFEMLTGQTPYQGAGQGEILLQHVLAPVPVLSPSGQLSAELCELVLHMLAKDPAERPKMAAVAAQLEEIHTHSGQTALPASGPSQRLLNNATQLLPGPYRPTLLAKRSWRVLIGAVLLALVAVGFLGRKHLAMILKLKENNIDSVSSSLSAPTSTTTQNSPAPDKEQPTSKTKDLAAPSTAPSPSGSSGRKDLDVKIFK